MFVFLKRLVMPETSNAKMTLLYRFHATVIIVNLIALGIDLYMQRSVNAFIEGSMTAFLLVNLQWLIRSGKVKIGAYTFLTVLSVGLMTLIYINHFATMSVVFVLLLPLLTLLFIRLWHSLIITAVLFTVMVGLLYLEYLNNPSNPLVQNPQALFNLGYAAVIIYVFGLLYHFSILTTFDELDASNRQKELLLKEVHHRVKNNLNVIASIVGLQANSLSETEKEPLLKSKIRIESIAMVHEMLYKSDDLAGIDFETYMRRLSGLLLGMYGKNRSVKVEILSDGVQLPLDVMVQLGIIANELLTNSIKYAFGEGEGTIRIEYRRGDAQDMFAYGDSGNGVADHRLLENGRSLGIKLVRLAAKQLRGNLEISSHDGLKYEIKLKHG